MSVNTKFLTELNIKDVLAAYRAEDKPTLEALADRFGTTHHTVTHIVKTNNPAEEYRLEKGLRLSRAKMGEKHPLFGKTGPLHPRWIGEVSDSKGRTTIKMDGKRYFTARVRFAEAIGLHPRDIPRSLEVHHIDGDPLNNDLGNLALVSPKAHKTLHALRNKFAKLPLWVQWLRSIGEGSALGSALEAAA